MASIISHAVAALGIGACFYSQGMPKRALVGGLFCSVIPDLDVIGFHFGVRYADLWGHRGFTHSLCFAILLSGCTLFSLFPRPTSANSRMLIWFHLFLATASHGVLDAMTDGGLGVAFLSPFNNHRYFFPWTPIRVSPIGITRFFSARGLAVLQTEVVWIWIPSLVLAFGAYFLRDRRTVHA
jgi:inner membrane protein